MKKSGKTMGKERPWKKIEMEMKKKRERARVGVGQTREEKEWERTGGDETGVKNGLGRKGKVRKWDLTIQRMIFSLVLCSLFDFSFVFSLVLLFFVLSLIFLLFSHWFFCSCTSNLSDTGR